MEVADQWRRQWAGTAEYGKVTEGGVTRRIARAMEVLHASAPGARVRVMRAAYHSTSGPGAPSSSYLMQSSRRVISSGYNLQEPLSLSSKPFEVSSLPLESSPDVDNEKINYKVTEPDDLEISEPSKWRNAMGKSTIRMPSEESSSADNVSIIDLDSRNNSRNTLTRSFRDSESNEDDIKNIHINNRISPLLDAPVTLSTLKYTSLLNGSDEWNNRRKSYSFEDTSTLNNKTYLRNSDALVMDSSTDSGICKSTEIFTDNASHYLESTSRRLSKDLSDLPEESFHDWLHKNRPSTTFKSTRVSPLKDYHRVYPANDSHNISLQSKGKVTITLPVMIERDDSNESSAINTDDNDRKTKKVEFCKTELHFAAESGTVNIISTDEKPPPSNDFRKKKSVFVPFTSKIDKSITLFGEKPNLSELNTNNDIDKHEYTDQDENTAATKGILKNRIPKPKPYLLGENMTLGISSENYSMKNDNTFPTAVSLMNRQLKIEKQQNNNLTNKSIDEDNNHTAIKPSRTLNAGPLKNVQSLYRKSYSENEKIGSLRKQQSREADKLNKYNPISLTPTLRTFKTRQLKDSELTYFGIDNDKPTEEIQTLDNLQEEILHSVKLVQKISNSVCNSEAESDDSHDYQNISSIKYLPVPTPKPRTKYIDVDENNRNMRSLKTISEGEKDGSYGSRRSKLKIIQESTSSRSISEPPKKDSQHSKNKIRESSLKRNVIESCDQDIKNQGDQRVKRHNSISIKPTESMYVNVNPKKNISLKKQTDDRNSSGKLKVINDDNCVVATKYSENFENMKNKLSRSEYRKPKRTEKLTTPDLSSSRNESNSTGNVKIKRSSVSSTNSLKKSPLHHDKITKYKENQVHKDENTGVAMTKDETQAGIKNVQKLRSRDYNSSTGAKSPKINQSPLKSKSSETDNMARSSSKTRKSKYVINYDDKNGTVSSICKIKPSQDSLRRKEVPLQNRYPKTEPKIKVANKSGLLNIPDQQWISNGVKRKSKMHAQKSCQLL